MKQIIPFLTFSALPFVGMSQAALYNNGGTISIRSGATVQVIGDFTNTTGTLSNYGTLRVSGNTTNNGTINASAASTLLLNGTSAQTLSGTQPVITKDVVVNNAAGITLNTRLQIEGTLTFTSGIITALNAAAPVVFTAGSSVGNTPTDASHVNGYVQKLGMGSFTFPVGSATKYQPVTVNLSANGSGLTALYVAGNAGAGTFTTAGTETSPLAVYNSGEYWNLLPLSTATGTVAINWDGNADAFSYSVANRRVAHKVGGAWINEGGTGTGTTAAGSVTSNSISSWSPFALGAVGSVLSVRWLSINGLISSQDKAQLQWSVEEKNSVTYHLEKSTDGRSFTAIATINSKGDGTNNYHFTEATALMGKAFYRIKKVDRDGQIAYSSIVTLSKEAKGSISVYPNPAKDKVLVSVPPSLLQTKAVLLTADGRVLQTVMIQANAFMVDVSLYAPGVYLMRFANGSTQKINKQ